MGVRHPAPPTFFRLKKSEAPNCLPAANICCSQSVARGHPTCKKLINGSAGSYPPSPEMCILSLG